MKPSDKVKNLIHPLLVVALVFVILIGMKEAAYFINIMLISLILTLLGIPLLKRLNRAGLPNALSVTIIIAIYILGIMGFIYLIYESAYVFLTNLPNYQDLFIERLSQVMDILSHFGITTDVIKAELQPDWQAISNMAISFVEGGSLLAMDIFFILVITCFALLEVPEVPRRLESVFGESSVKIDTFREMGNNIIKWLVVKTKTNVVLGVSFGGLLFALGIDMAVFWALMAIILSYIPYLGLIIVSIPAIFLAWLQLGVWGAVVVIIGICVINAVVENFVFSKFAANSFQIPPLVVIVTLILWSWVLGTIGLFLSVPFTVILVGVLQTSDNTKWIAELLGFKDPGENRAQKDLGEDPPSTPPQE